MGKKSGKNAKSGSTGDATQSKLGRKAYERELFRLHTELVKLQKWVVDKGERIIVVFEGRDAAGKGGVIKRITERVSPRVFRVVALPAPTERERTQLYIQRYLANFPSAGEIVLFDRSWYNRAGVERVMDFCTDEQYRRFLSACPGFEKTILDDGIRLFKYWFDVSEDVQEERMRARITDPRKQWKLSPMDLESRRRWYDYSRARDAMLAATDTIHAPWYIVEADNKKRARLNCISHLLNNIPYQDLPGDPIKLPKRDTKEAYDDVATLSSRTFVPRRF